MSETMLSTESPPAVNRFVTDAMNADVTVILVSYNTERLITRCLSKLREASTGLAVRVIIVDNASRDDSVKIIKSSFPDCLLIENKDNVGFGRANNQVLPLCASDFVLLLNTDAFVKRDTLSISLEYMRANPACGIVGVQLTDEDGRCHENPARQFPTLWRDFALRTGLKRPRRLVPTATQLPAILDCDWVPGCYYLVRKQLIDSTGLFDPRYFLYFEEVDHCLTAKRAGWQIHCLLTTTVIHVGGASAAADGAITGGGRQLSHLQLESEQLFFRKHYGLSGAIAATALSILANLIVACKLGVRGQVRRHLVHFWRSSSDILRAAKHTTLGLKAAR